eukprot:g2934.t1
MLRSVIVFSSSGLVLFSKNFLEPLAQHRMVASLITAIMKFCTDLLDGMPVSYIELGDICVSIVSNKAANLNCAVFHTAGEGSRRLSRGASSDVSGLMNSLSMSLSGSTKNAESAAPGTSLDQGNSMYEFDYAFGSLIARQLLLGFLDTFQANLLNAGHNLQDFASYNYKISEVIRDSVQPVLEKLVTQKGLQTATLIVEDSYTYSTKAVDEIGLRANLQALSGISADIMGMVDDSSRHVWLDVSKTTRILVWSLVEERASLVVKCNKNVRFSKVSASIQDALVMIRRLCGVMSSLHHNRG